MNVLVTGCAGFIGSHLVERLLEEGYSVIGLDNFNDYYDPKIKKTNLKKAQLNNRFKLVNGDILDLKLISEIFKKHKIDYIVHLAARAGVRPSIENPLFYADVNKIGTLNLLKAAQKYKVKKFIFASSSSVYGNTKAIPFAEDDPCDSIISPYGASKRAAEYYIETFHKLYGLNSVILRFFTVFGPRGRPDMAPFIFSNAILKGEEIKQFGLGSSRDYTFIDDIIDGVVLSIEKDLSYEIINLGNSSPVEISEFIRLIENVSGRKAKVEITGRMRGDVMATWADISKAKRLLGWGPKTSLSEGLKTYLKWLRA